MEHSTSTVNYTTRAEPKVSKRTVFFVFAGAIALAAITIAIGH